MLENLTIKKFHRLIEKKETSITEVVDLYLKNIKGRNKELNAYLEVFSASGGEDEVFKQAREIDKKLAHGDMPRALEGVAVAVKDNILIEGRVASAASRILENYKAVYDSTVISRLKAAGALLLGRTNMDEFAMGSSTENSAFGVTKNPHDTSRVPGGSSGGSAAAVVADLALTALGSDTGGSIRQPAAFCGVVGLKPTYGAVSRFGLIAMASSLDQIGPITRSVEDAEIIFNVIKGKDPRDSTTIEIRNQPAQLVDKKPAPIDAESGEQETRIQTIGVPKEFFVEGLDREIKNSIDNVIKKLEVLGYKFQEVSLPHTPYALPCYYIIMPAEVSTNLARFDGIRYGLSESGKNLLEVYENTRHKGFGKEVRRRILLGTYVLSSGYYDEYYARAQKVRSLIREDFKKAFEQVDILISPVTPTPPFKIGEKVLDPVSMYLSDIFTVSANLAGIPALAAPAGKTSSGLPISVQFMAPWFEENRLFAIGKEVEKL